MSVRKSQIDYLGFHIKEGKIFHVDKNLKAIKEFPVPKNKNIKQFLGLCNYYRKFLDNFAYKALLLTKLTQGKINFNWSNECQAAFECLKSESIKSPCLITPDINRDFILYTDASDYAIGAVTAAHPGFMRTQTESGNTTIGII